MWNLYHITSQLYEKGNANVLTFMDTNSWSFFTDSEFGGGTVTDIVIGKEFRAIQCIGKRRTVQILGSDVELCSGVGITKSCFSCPAAVVY